MKKTITLVLFAIIFITSCQGQTSNHIQVLDANAFAEKINATPQAQVIDVRTPEEYATTHIENAQNINWLNEAFVNNLSNLDKSKPVFVYCKAGSRSQKAAAKLAELGFTSIYDLQGGILKWEAAGLGNKDNKQVGITQAGLNDLLNTNKKVLVNFFAPWCAPCKKMEPYLLKMQKETNENLVIVRLNADQNSSIMKTLKIEELPTMLLYKDKKVIWKSSGFVSEDDLRKQL